VKENPMGDEQQKHLEELTSSLVRIVWAFLDVAGPRPAALTLGVSFPTGDGKAAVHTATLALSPELERSHAQMLAQSLAAEPKMVDTAPAGKETPA